MEKKDRRSQFTKVLETHKGIIHKIAMSYSLDVEERKDLIQEITLQMWRSFHNYDPQYKISTWMYRIALNVSISFRKKETVRKAQLREGTQVDFVEFNYDSEEGRNPDYAILQSSIARLKEVDRALIILHLEGNDNQEIAQIMGISVSNVSTRLNRIRTKLQTIFRELKRKYNG